MTSVTLNMSMTNFLNFFSSLSQLFNWVIKAQMYSVYLPMILECLLSCYNNTIKKGYNYIRKSTAKVIKQLSCWFRRNHFFCNKLKSCCVQWEITSFLFLKCFCEPYNCNGTEKFKYSSYYRISKYLSSNA